MVESSPSSAGTPSIAIAWMVLIHSGFIGAAIAGAGLSVGLVIVLYADFFRGAKLLQNLAIAWNVSSFFITAWTLYAIAQTWKASYLFPPKDQIFGEFGFASLAFITAVVGIFNIYTLWIGWIWKPRPKPPPTNHSFIPDTD
jgi:hypothetical protein